MSYIKHCLFTLCLLCTLWTQGSGDTECCEGCEIRYSGKISRKAVASKEVKMQFIQVAYKCSTGWLWGGRNVCFKYRQVYYTYTKYKTMYCKSVGMKCKPGCGLQWMDIHH